MRGGRANYSSRAEPLGFVHKKLTYRFLGRDYRLTDVHGKVINGVLA
jgi:hypothetical protein